MQAIESALESTVLVYLIESSSSEEDELEQDEFEENIGDLLAIQEVITSSQYLYRGDSTGHHTDHSYSLEEYIQHYPKSIFLNLFHMHRISFWKLDEWLTEAGRLNYWGQVPDPRRPGLPPKPIYQQITVALYV